MKKISAETTRYMMDAMAYTFVAATVAATGEEPTAEEIDSHVRTLMALYCRSEGIEPDYHGIASCASCPGCCGRCDNCTDEDEDDWHDDDDDDDDSWHDEDEDEDDWNDDDEEDDSGDDVDDMTLTETLHEILKYIKNGK